MKKFRKLLVATMLGAMLLGSTGVQAAGVSPAGNKVAAVTTKTTTTKDTVTWMYVKDGLFSISGENIKNDLYSDTCSIDGAYVKGGKWMKDKKGSWYKFSDGTYPKNAAIIIKSSNKYAISSWKKYKNTSSPKFTDSIEVKSDGTYTSKKSGSGTFTDKIYYFDSKGYLVKSSYIWNHKIDANGVVRASSGKAGEWKTDSKGTYFKTDDGKKLKPWYYLVPETGKRVNSSFYVIYKNKLVKYGNSTKDGTVYSFNGSGYLQKSQFVKDKNVYRWTNKNGVVDMKKSYTWHKDKTGQWFGDKTWYAKSTTYTIDGKKYKFNAKGYLVK